MNAPYPLRPTSDEWTIVSGNYRIYGFDDIPEDAGCVTDCTSGTLTAYFRNDWGQSVRITLGIPYCGTCDRPLAGNLCVDCRTLHADIGVGE